MSQQFVIYRLNCDCPKYTASLMPPGFMDSMEKMMPDFRSVEVRHAGVLSFYSLSKDPAAVFEDAVQFLVSKQREAQQQYRDDLEPVFEEFRRNKGFNWDPAEFEIPGGLPSDMEESFLQELGRHINHAQGDYSSMISHIKLVPEHVVSVADSAVLDRAVRFVTKPEYYLAQTLGMRDQGVMMSIRRDFAELKDLVKRRLCLMGYDGDPYTQERIAKLTYDLDQRFPIDFDDM
jgi:hypothetical protein